MPKRRNEEAEGENSERWLLTYSDLITLLLALFIILYSIAQVDAAKFNAIASQFREQIGDQPDAGNAPYMEPPVSPPAVSSSSSADTGTGALQQVYEDLLSYIDLNMLGDQITVEATDTYVRIRIKEAIMFLPDQAVLLSPSLPILQDLEAAINVVYSDIDRITFSGHTADIGNYSLESEQTSWRLSTERAIAVLNNFIAFGMEPQKLSVQGFAYFEPVAENDTEEGRAQNRRVEITIYNEPAGASSLSSAPASSPASEVNPSPSAAPGSAAVSAL